MDFGFTSEQEMIRSEAAEFLQHECPVALVRDLMENEHCYDHHLWQKMAAMGWMGLVFPEEYGGTGLTFVELMILLEEMGRDLVPSKFFSSVLLAGFALLAAGSEEQKKSWLSLLVEGKLRATLAILESNCSWMASGISTVRADLCEGGYVISGTKLFVPDAHVSDLIICAARTGSPSFPEEGITLFAVDRNSDGLCVNPLKTM